MKNSKRKSNRIIGLDMHPDVFAAGCLEGSNALEAKVLWKKDRLETARLESFCQKHLLNGDIVVLEASGNSFEIARRIHALGYTALVLESYQASKVCANYCNDDLHSAVKLARVYLSGLAKTVWQPDPLAREHREIFFAHRNAVKDTTRLRNRIRSYLNEHCIRLPAGTRLTHERTLSKVLLMRQWSELQRHIIQNYFEQLWQAETRRKELEKIMVVELFKNPQWAQLCRLMGIRHRVAFALMAIIGDIHRFANAKKLVGYLGLSPSKIQSGNNAKGYECGIGHGGRKDLRQLLLQSAQNALNQRESPLHRWGWKLLLRKNRNIAAAAVARKLAVAIWHLLMGHYTELTEKTTHLTVKFRKLATVLGMEKLRSMGYRSQSAFIEAFYQKIQLST